jgi:hypothetical protein
MVPLIRLQSTRTTTSALRFTTLWQTSNTDCFRDNSLPTAKIANPEVTRCPSRVPSTLYFERLWRRSPPKKNHSQGRRRNRRPEQGSSTWSSRITDLLSHDGVGRVTASSSVEPNTRDTPLGVLGERSAADSIIDDPSELYTRPESLSLPPRVEEDRGTDLASDDPSPRGNVHCSTSPPTSTVPFNVNAIAWSPKNDDIDLPGVDSSGSPLTRSVDEGTIGLDIGSDDHSIDHDFNELLELDRPVQQPVESATRSNPIWTGEVCNSLLMDYEGIA